MEDKYIPDMGNTSPAEINGVQAMNFRRDRMFLWDKDAYCRIFYSEITWLEASRNYCCIHLRDRPKILVANPLQTFENTLPGDRFTRVHRSHMINLEHVDRVRGNTIYIGKQEIPLGQPYRERFLARFYFLGSVKGLHK